MSRMSDPYALHRDFVRRAAPRSSPWKILRVVAVYAAVFFLFPVVLYFLLPEQTYQAFYTASTPVATFANFAVFGVSAYALVTMTRRVHGFGFWSLIGPYARAFQDFRVVMVAVAMLLVVVQFVVPFGTWGEVERTRNILLWTLLLPLSLGAILVQVTTEELVFRGYLQQQLAQWSQSRLIWMVFPSAIFGAWHYWNGYSAPEGIVYAIWAGLLGMACADLTARTGTLGAAIGLHFAVNVMAVMIMGIAGWPLSGMALIVLPYVDPLANSALIAEAPGVWMIFATLWSVLSVLTMWLAARIAIKR